MEVFYENVGLFQIGMDPELESDLRKCRTQEEKREVWLAYTFKSAKNYFFKMGILLLVVITTGLASWILKWGSLGVAGMSVTLA